MPFKHLLVHVDSTERAAERLDLAFALARQHGARLTGLFAEADVLGPGLVGRRSMDHMLQALGQARAAFEGRAGTGGVATEWWQIEPGEHGAVVGQAEICCRYADLAVFGQHDPESARAPEDLVDQVILRGGRPVLVVPSVGHYPQAGQRVLVSWNGSREATRALHDALPFLERAAAVHVLAFQKPPKGVSPMPPLDISSHLAAHGIQARYEPVIVDAEEIDVADMLLSRGFDLQIDLTVMGGYAHGFPAARVAASTRKVLRSMTSPVLISH
jgi:nucleotide-binding universal stress UspA family protein